MTDVVHIPKWIAVSIIAPLVVAALISAATSTVMILNLRTVVAALQATAVTKTYVDNQVDRLRDQTTGRYKFIQYQIQKNQDAIDTNRARAADNHDQILKLKRHNSNTVWRIPERPNNPKTILVSHPVLTDRNMMMPKLVGG